MIKKWLDNLRAKVSQLSLYWKTWTITTITILLTLVLFFGLFSIFASKFLGNAQQNKFNKQAQLIFDSVQKEGINDQFLTDKLVNGFSIYIKDDKETIFPPYSDHFFSVGLNDQAAVVDSAENNIAITQTVPFMMDNESSLLSASRQINYKGKDYHVQIYYPVAVNPEEIKNVFHSIIPYFIVIGLLVSFVVSVIYSRYFSRKISWLSGTVQQMAISNLVEEYEANPGDELQELENNIHHMYQELQQTLERLNDEMVTVKQLEADREVFMRGATHELKTPIMAMTTTLEGMMQHITGYENTAEHLQACYSRLQSMSRLVNEMLEVSRIEAVVFSGEMDLAEATAEVIEVYRYMLEDKELTIINQQTTGQTVKIPKRNLQKIISNLVGNAVKYTPEKGSITITSQPECWQIKNQLNLPVKLDKAKIFEPFVSFETASESEAEKSHGLGLYVVDAILKQYNYHYSCQIDENLGEFIFTIKPLSNRTAE